MWLLFSAIAAAALGVAFPPDVWRICSFSNSYLQLFSKLFPEDSNGLVWVSAPCHLTKPGLPFFGGIYHVIPGGI